MADLLKFQIQHITSRRLQRELFEAFAPALKVDWEGLPQVEKELIQQGQSPLYKSFLSDSLPSKVY